MLGWFKKKKAEEVPLELEQIINNHLGPTLLAAELVENISKYFKRVEGGEISFPAYKRKDSNVLQVWIDTRLELLHCLWSFFDNFNPIVLTEEKRQKELLAYIKEADVKIEKTVEVLNKYVMEEMSPPKYTLSVKTTNKELKDMLSVIILMYQTSLNISHEICVVEVEKAMGHKPDALKIGIGSLLTWDPFQELESTMGIKDFLEVVNKVSSDWLCYCNKLDKLDSHEPLPARPKTIFEIIFEDITRKSKIIALTALFGPHYGKTFMSIIEKYKEKGAKKGLSPEEAKEQQELFDYLINAKNPEEVIERMKKTRVGSPIEVIVN